MIKTLIKKITPNFVLSAYHKILAILANIVYGFPSRKMIVVGVTGTKGKSSTVFMVARILEQAGFKVGSTNTIFFKIGEKEYPNNLKQGMPGRFKLQKMLYKMAKAGCTHAVIEVTSEGILQNRQWGIIFDVAVFTNLSPEHIESHGSFENYKKAKSLIFKNLSKGLYKNLFGNEIKKIIVANRSCEHAGFFLGFQADEKWSVWTQNDDLKTLEGEKTLIAEKIIQTKSGVVLGIEGKEINLKIQGKFMAKNALLAFAVCKSLGVSLNNAKFALEKINFIPGRSELIDCGQDFSVIVDYAHEPLSFGSVLSSFREIAKENRLITVFGATGGGRDKSKRPEMGKIAAQYSDFIILTTDDPYDDDPNDLINDIEPGIISRGDKWKDGINLFKIVDRREAILKALEIASKGDFVAILGKGSEPVMAVGGGKLIPWSDKDIVKNFLLKK